jgi:hypothetical protein
MDFKTLLLILCIQIVLINVNKTEAFNFFNEIFDDLRVGSIDKDYLIQKLDNSKLKCIQGSYFFNGSCYIISNKRYRDRSSFIETDDASDFLIKRGKKIKNTVLSSVISPSTALNVYSLPEEAPWKNANISCAILVNDSSLIYFNNENEYEFLLNLLKELNFPGIDNNKNDKTINENEQKYFIGLTFNSKYFN